MIGVSRSMFLMVPDHPGSPTHRAIKVVVVIAH